MGAAPLKSSEQVERCLHVQLEFLAHEVKWEGDLAQLGFVVAQRLVEIAEDAPKITNYALFLKLVVRAVHPRDGLEQGVVPQPLVQVHGLHDRSVESSQQHVAHNDDLGLAPALLFPAL